MSALQSEFEPPPAMAQMDMLPELVSETLSDGPTNSDDGCYEPVASHQQAGSSPKPLVGSSPSPGLNKRPASWITSMVASSFFAPCTRHAHLKKNECTYFCTSCGDEPHSLCQHCVGSHLGHQLIQIRRYVYCDVIRACDINVHVDTTGVQNYIINQAKVMFLNHRPHSKPGKPGAADTCRTCRRHLREGYFFCSLACKLEALHTGECLDGCGMSWSGFTASDTGAACCEEHGASPHPQDSDRAPTISREDSDVDEQARKRQRVMDAVQRQQSTDSALLPAPPAYASSSAHHMGLSIQLCSAGSGGNSSKRRSMASRRKQYRPMRSPVA